MPDGEEPCPQQSVCGCQLGPFHWALKHADLVAERKNLELERQTAAEPARQGHHDRRANSPNGN
jgi:hypothetical protein